MANTLVEKSVFFLGNHHIYYLGELVEVDYGYYQHWSDRQKADTKVKKFGAKWGVPPSPIDLNHYASGRTTFNAYRRSWPDQPADGFNLIIGDYPKTELVDAVAQLIKGKPFLYHINIHTNYKNYTSFVTYHPDLENDEDFQSFKNYIMMTK